MSSMTERSDKGGIWQTRVRNWLVRLVRPPRPAVARLQRWEHRHIGAALLSAVLVFALLMVTLDAVAIVDARGLPYGVHRFFDIITDYGKSGWVLWPAGLIVAAAGVAAGTVSQRVGLLIASIATRAMFVLAAVGLPGLFVNLVKGLIGRARPFVGGSADPYLFSPWTWKPAYASFPSGHGQAAAGIAVALGALFPRARVVLWIYAAFIFVSRVVVTAHHPSDVLGGALVGGIGAWLVLRFFAARGLGFRIALDGHIAPMAGPSWRRIKRVATGAASKA